MLMSEYAIRTFWSPLRGRALRGRRRPTPRLALRVPRQPARDRLPFSATDLDSRARQSESARTSPEGVPHPRRIQRVRATRESRQSWDSGRVESANSVLVPYAGKPLPTGAAAFWKVQVWDQDNARVTGAPPPAGPSDCSVPMTGTGTGSAGTNPAFIRTAVRLRSSRARGGSGTPPTPGLRACRRPLFPARVHCPGRTRHRARRSHLRRRQQCRRVPQWRARRDLIIRRDAAGPLRDPDGPRGRKPAGNQGGRTIAPTVPRASSERCASTSPPAIR